MFQAKEKRNNFCFYEQGMEAEIAKRLRMEQELRKAIDEDELVLHYQPQICLESVSLSEPKHWCAGNIRTREW